MQDFLLLRSDTTTYGFTRTGYLLNICFVILPLAVFSPSLLRMLPYSVSVFHMCYVCSFILKNLWSSLLCSDQIVLVQDVNEGKSEESVVTIKVRRKLSYNSWVHILLSHKTKSLQGLTEKGYLYAIDEDFKQFELKPDGNR